MSVELRKKARMPQPEQWLEDHYVFATCGVIVFGACLVGIVVTIYSLLP